MSSAIGNSSRVTPTTSSRRTDDAAPAPAGSASPGGTARSGGKDAVQPRPPTTTAPATAGATLPPPGSDAPIGSLAGPQLRLSDVSLQFARRPWTSSLPTVDASTRPADVPTYLGPDGQRLPLEQIAQSLRGDPNAVWKIANIISRIAPAGQSGPIIGYAGEVDDLNEFHLAPEEVWRTGRAQCDGIMAVAVYLLNASGAASEAYGSQAFIDGLWHNPIPYRDATTGRWMIMNYQNVVTLPADVTNAADALRAYYPHGAFVVYSINTPQDRPVALYHARTDGSAMQVGAAFSPGIGAAMAGEYGTLRGHNDQPGAPGLPGPSDRRTNTTNLEVSRVRMSQTTRGGTRVEAEARAPGIIGTLGRAPGVATDFMPDRAGVGVLTPAGQHGAAGGKLLYYRHAGGQAGTTATAAGEYWYVNGGNFIGVVAGVEGHFDIPSPYDGARLSTVAPFVGVSGGTTHTIVNSERVRAEAFWNGHARLTLPLSVTDATRNSVSESSNGNIEGGWMDHGALAAGSSLGANAGARVDVRLSDRVSAGAQVAGHAEVTDPTLAPLSMYVPFRGSVDASGRVRYDGPRVQAEVGGSYTVGSIYDRDSRWQAWGAAGIRLSDNVRVDAAASGGQLVNGTGHVTGRAGLTWTPRENVRVNAGAGATVLHTPGYQPQVLPSGGLSLGFDF